MFSKLSKYFRNNWLSFISLAAFFLIWEAVVDLRFVPHALLNSPIEVITLFFAKINDPNPDGSVLIVHLASSMKVVLTGYILGLVIGVPLGLLMGWYKVLDGLVRPIFELIRPIPPVAWIPLAIFWFGIGLSGKAFIIWASALVPAVINSYFGVCETKPVFIRLAKTYGATDWEIFRKVCVPSALPMVYTGMQVAVTAAWTCLVAAELLAANNGLGFMIQMGRRLARPDLIILGMMLVGITGVIVTVILDKIEGKNN